MSSDLMVYGAWRFPARAGAGFRAAALTYPAHSHADGSMAAAFAAVSSATKVATVLTGARSLTRFLQLELDGDALTVRGVLADDDWVEACAQLGALARAASALGAKGHLTVESDGNPLGRLVLGARAIFDSRTGRAFEDKAGRADLIALWNKLDGVPEPAADALTPAQDRALAKRWLVAEAKYRETWFQGKPEAFIVKELVQVKADFYTGARAKAASERAAKAARASKAASGTKRRP